MIADMKRAMCGLRLAWEWYHFGDEAKARWADAYVRVEVQDGPLLEEFLGIVERMMKR